MTLAVSMRGLNQVVDKINAHVGKHMVSVSTKGDVALIILVGEDIQKFECIIDGMFFLKGLEEGISLMKGEIG